MTGPFLDQTQQMEPIVTKILVVDDHAVVRQGVKQILNEQFQGAVIGEARNAEEMIDRIRKFTWDIVVLDVGMPGKSGLDALKELKQVCPKLPVLVLSAYPEDQLARRMLKAGASGYLTKDSAPNELVQALKKILGGGKFVSASMAELLVANLNEEAGRPQHELLSDREYQVMCLIAVGKSLKEIADDLCVGISTINTYRARILEKMQFKNNTELTHYALENRLVNRLVS
ncbi:MAG TPA: response regulator transcription factor [Nitrospira sp.]|nr:response regulator transcription factor [Nitrospira sp.]HMW84678.1 response regulator transcription factor [Nitrospira sp.]HMZ95613.1 response regulator transcription factor [Nitrospira sp.]HNA45808.1 response regulator transcription factor [Nitrospira sp.]HND02329.1 response regulator transcription factor [Nitrospira sp.]